MVSILFQICCLNTVLFHANAEILVCFPAVSQTFSYASDHGIRLPMWQGSGLHWYSAAGHVILSDHCILRQCCPLAWSFLNSPNNIPGSCASKRVMPCDDWHQTFVASFHAVYNHQAVVFCACPIRPLGVQKKKKEKASCLNLNWNENKPLFIPEGELDYIPEKCVCKFNWVFSKA